MENKIIQKYLPVGSLRRSGQLITPKVVFIVAHDTGNDKSTAMNNVNYYINSANEMEASAHTFVDDKETIECIPQTEKAWHVRKNMPLDNQIYGGDSNNCAIGVELCFFSNDLERTKKAYANYVAYIRGLCTKYQLDPTKHVIGHYTLDPERRTDPLNAFKHIGKTWADFIKDLSPTVVPPPVTPEPEYKVKVRKLIKVVDSIKSELESLL